MNNMIAGKRAELSGKLTHVLDARSLAASHPRLAELLRPGMTVLDVGCGTGAITRGIAEAVGAEGRVVGIDSSPKLIEKAQQAHGHVPGLTFVTGDVYQLPFTAEFDIVTSARLLVWLSDPLKAIIQMRDAAKAGGKLVVTDYNHDKIVWAPAPPSSMRHFYYAYLKWRSDAGMDNAIADQLPALFQDAGLEQIGVTSQHEHTVRTDPDFLDRISIWADTASSRGVQMERDGYISVQDYLSAEKEYRDWIQSDAQMMTMYMLSVEGVRG